MKIQLFDGGLNIRQAPQTLGINQATVLNNVDNTSKTLKAANDMLPYPSLLNPDDFAQYFETDNEWLSFSTYRDSIEFQGKLYYENTTSRPSVRTGGVTTPIGITPPAAKPAISSVDSAPPAIDSIDNLTADTASNLALPSFRSYQYLVVNEAAGLQSKPLTFQVTPSKSLISARFIAGEDYRDLDLGEKYFRNFGVNFTDVTTTYSTITLTRPETSDIQNVKVYRLYQGTYYLVGTLTAYTDTLLDNVLDISANAAFSEGDYGQLIGTYQYVYTYYQSSTGLESGPSAVSDETDLEVSGRISLDVVASAESKVDEIRIYRVGGDLSLFALVDTIANTTTTYADSIADTDVEGTILSTQGYSEPPNLTTLTEAYAMLFGAVGTRVYFTPIGKPEVWPSDYYLEFKSTVTGTVAVANGVLVFTSTKTWLINGTGPTTLAQTVLDGTQGCVSKQTIQDFGDGAIWVSNDGICGSNGTDIQVVSKNELGKYPIANAKSSALYDEVYYVMDTDGVTTVLDMRFGKQFKTYTLGVLSLAVGADKLYGVANGVLNELFADTTTLSMSYTSPRFIEGRATEIKTYKKVYIYSKGYIILSVYIDDKLVASKEFTSEDGHVIQVPQIDQRGHFIQFKVEGTGEVYELEYMAEPRRNG